MPIDIMAAVRAVGDIDKCVGVIAKYAAQLRANPDQAAGDLAEALEEIEKSCRTLDDAIKKYMALGYKADALRDGSDFLLDVSGGALLVGVRKGLGSCSKIRNIYRKTLDRWFERVFQLDKPALAEMKAVFDKLGEADGDVFDMMFYTARQLQDAADGALQLVGKGQTDEARAHVLASAKELNALRVGINELLARLYELRARFISVAGV